MTFENYLQEIYIRERSHVLDDDLPDDFDNWVSDLQPDDLIALAEKWAQTL